MQPGDQPPLVQHLGPPKQPNLMDAAHLHLIQAGETEQLGVGLGKRAVPVEGHDRGGQPMEAECPAGFGRALRRRDEIGGAALEP